MSVFKKAVLALAAPVAALSFGGTAHAAAVFPACDVSLLAGADACSGYYSGNLLGGSGKKIAAQQTGVAALPSDFTFNGDWSAVDATKITALGGSGANTLDFGQTLYGETIIGIHFGNVAGAPKGGGQGNVTGFWSFDFGAAGATGIELTNTRGFSNAVLYTTGTGAVPEPATWMFLLLGFGAIGGALRRRPTPGTGLVSA